LKTYPIYPILGSLTEEMSEYIGYALSSYRFVELEDLYRSNTLSDIQNWADKHGNDLSWSYITGLTLRRIFEDASISPHRNKICSKMRIYHREYLVTLFSKDQIDHIIAIHRDRDQLAEYLRQITTSECHIKCDTCKQDKLHLSKSPDCVMRHNVCILCDFNNRLDNIGYKCIECFNKYILRKSPYKKIQFIENNEVVFEADALLDTGAETNIISQSLLSKLLSRLASVELGYLTEALTITYGNSNKQAFKKYIVINVVYSNKKKLVFLVSNDLNVRCILGMPAIDLFNLA
jgi:hypothetical protein